MSHVSISIWTEISIHCLYLDTIEYREYYPAIVKTDRGSEKSMMEQTHFELCFGEIEERQAMTEKEKEAFFKKCYYYGTNTSNQRIEAWWGQLSKGQ